MVRGVLIPKPAMLKPILCILLFHLAFIVMNAQQQYHPQLAKYFNADGEITNEDSIQKISYLELEDERIHETSRVTFMKDRDSDRWLEITRFNDAFNKMALFKSRQTCVWDSKKWQCRTSPSHTYNSDGRLSSIYFSNSGEASFHSTYLTTENYYYYDEGLNVEIVSSTYWYDVGSGPINWKKRLFYDSENRLSKDTLYNGSQYGFSIRNASQYHYNEIGLLSEKLTKRRIGVDFVDDSKVVNLYNDDGQLLSRTTYKFDQIWIGDSLIEYHYSGDTLLREDYFIWDDQLSEWQNWKYVIFDEFLENEIHSNGTFDLKLSADEGRFFEIYPNPGQYISLSPYDHFHGSFFLRIYDSFGRTCLEENFIWFDIDALRQHTDLLPQGCYVVIISDGKKIQKLKWTKINTTE